MTTANTFQTALAASTSRKGCTIQNTSTDVEYVYTGATGSATLTNSQQVQPGGQYLCANFAGGLAGDNLAITGPTTGDTYVLVSQ